VRTLLQLAKAPVPFLCHSKWMRNFLFVVGIIAISLLNSKELKVKPVNFAIAAADLKLTILLPKTSFSSKESVELVLVIENTSNKPISTCIGSLYNIVAFGDSKVSGKGTGASHSGCSNKTTIKSRESVKLTRKVELPVMSIGEQSVSVTFWAYDPAACGDYSCGEPHALSVDDLKIKVI
jgi:hypothetical protein